ncbi:hypothetical protein E3983_03110 [Legionella israelensis]|uniref:Uncharacterized protein n=1 Tax=Legionella israelensis TaxID=454 RepID=A0AAX1EF28_9GAMM|nr:hypothetical protein [Legionella israelensis]QBR83439.1 hypothetical protein E3983_03110 [Legionella israelensis]
MFEPFELITPVNKSTVLKFVDANAPFYSKLCLYHNSEIVSDCSFKPEEKKLIKENMQEYTSLIDALKTLNSNVKSKYLSEFIALVEKYKGKSHQSSAEGGLRI